MNMKLYMPVMLLIVIGLAIAAAYGADWAGRLPSASEAPAAANELQPDAIVEEVLSPVAASTNGTIRTYINVAAATLWTAPDTHRPLDEPSLQYPADVKEWTSKLSIPQRYWLLGKLETQALLGQEVAVLERTGEWVKVAVKDQRSSKHELGYPGWLPQRQLIETAGFATGTMQERIVVSEPLIWLYDDASEQRPFLEISFDTRLPVVAIQPQWIAVNTPGDGVKWVKRSEVKLLAQHHAAPLTSGESLIATAERFIGLPYLWAGISAYGFDCSGFTHTLYRYYNIDLPRDAEEQFLQGVTVAQSELKPGDLLFFSYADGTGIRHVAMYAGDGEMVHSPNPERSVERIPLDTAPYDRDYVGARRYINANNN